MATEARDGAVLVTGSTGLLGAHLAGHLRAAGERVRVLTRATSDLRRLADVGAELVQGDVNDLASLERAAAGCTRVFHCAGLVSDWAPREEFLRVNRDGTGNVVEACRRAGVARLVHVSSLTVLGLPRDGAVLDETAPVAQGRLDFYTESKLAGERLVTEAHGKGLETTVVRPGVIWGPGDATIVPRIAALLRRGLMVHISGGRNRLGLSHVENLSRGLALAGSVPAAAGRLYHVTDDEEITARTAVELLARALGVRPPRLSLPFAVVHALAAVLEAAGRVGRRRAPPALTRYGVRLVACDARWDVSRARSELGYRPAVTFAQGIGAAAAGL